MDEAEINAINVCTLNNSIIVNLNYKKFFSEWRSRMKFFLIDFMIKIMLNI